MATLAAFAMRTLEDEQGPVGLRVTCMTFGAPRTGNHPFAAEYESMCPDTWHIINDQVGGCCHLKKSFRPKKRLAKDGSHLEAHQMIDI